MFCTFSKIACYSLILEMRLLLLQSYLGRPEPPIAPLGLAVLTGQIPTQHQLKIFDPNLFTNPYPATESILYEFEPELIGVSLRNLDTTKFHDPFVYFEYFPQFIKFLRSKAPECLIVVGGTGFALFPRLIMEKIAEIDFGFYLEAENSFPQFLSAEAKVKDIPGIFYRHNEQILFSGEAEKPDITRLNPPRWDLVDLSVYLPFQDKSAIGIESKRGCAMHCSYCTYPLLEGSELRLKEPRKVVEEMEILQQQYGVGRVFFCDPIFNFPLQHAQQICQEILDKRIKINWSGYHTDRDLTSEYLELARESGCDEFYFSPDAVTDNGLAILNKGIKARSVHLSLKLLAQNRRAHAYYSFFATFPRCGWRDFLSAIWFLIKARLMLKYRLNRFKFNYIRLEPHTLLTQEFIKSNKIRDEAFLLPHNSRELNHLFYRKSASFTLNLLIFIHFWIGRLFMRKNIL
jgi:radical SAM superfamily enzyme YgiQ (UPF0313 family)